MPKEKKVELALPLLFGIGKASGIKICRELGFAPKLKVANLTADQELAILKKMREEYRLESNLREEIKGNIQHYISNGSIRGFRHRNKLPVRGQRTQSNGKTPRRVIMGIASKIKK